MPDEIQGFQVTAGGHAIKFGIVIDGKHRFCLVAREILNDLSESTSGGDDLKAEFVAHIQLIQAKAIQAIKFGLTGDPLNLPVELFFPPDEAKR